QGEVVLSEARVEDLDERVRVALARLPVRDRTRRGGRHSQRTPRGEKRPTVHGHHPSSTVGLREEDKFLFRIHARNAATSPVPTAAVSAKNKIGIRAVRPPQASTTRRATRSRVPLS